MDEQKKKKRDPTIVIGNTEYPEKPGLLDRLKEGFQPTNTRVQLDLIRKRRAANGS